VEQCLNGRSEAYRHLVKRYQRPLLSYLTGLLGQASEAEEAAQDTFVRAYSALDRLRKPDAFFSWLLAIGTRVAKDQQRAAQRNRKIARALSRPEAPADNLEASPAANYGLRRAISGLPAVYREVILVRYYGELSCSEVAARLGMPLGTVTKRLSRAHAMLRERLAASNECEAAKDCEVDR
jgi:RNA polymerase sigma-70 factor (ECF subfamily)